MLSTYSVSTSLVAGVRWAHERIHDSTEANLWRKGPNSGINKQVFQETIFHVILYCGLC